MRLNINISKKKIFLLFFNVIFWFSIFFVILKIANLKINLDIFNNIVLSRLAISFVFYILFAWIRGIRFAYILDSKNYLVSYGISGIYVLSCAVFPGGIGEAMLPVYTKKYLGIPFSKGAALLLTTRVFDVLFVIIFFIFSLFANSLSLNKLNILNLTGFFIIILIFSIIILIFFYDKARIFIIQLIKQKVERNDILPSIAKKMIVFMERINDDLTHINSKKKNMVIFLTLISRISIFISFLFLFKSLNLNISIVQAVFISTFATIMLIIPVQGLGGFGSYEIWITMALLSIGIARNIALSTSVPVQLLMFLFSLAEGILGYLFLAVSRKKVL